MDYVYQKDCNIDTLADEIFAALGKRVRKNVPEDTVDGYLLQENSTTTIHFDIALTPEEKDTLDIVVFDNII